MKTFPAGFTTEMAKKTGITPVWILRQVINGVTYDLSDSTFTFPGGTPNGFTSTRPWIADWGEVRESISGAIGEMLISDFSVTVLVDQDASDNIRVLALTQPLEKSPAELYLWFAGLNALTDPPQLMFRGYVKDIDVPDETQVHLTIEDESTRLQKYIGTRISSEAYPLCDPDEVGKMIPIVYGSVTGLPALCVDSGWVTSIVADMTPADTAVVVSELPSYPVVGKTIVIDDEQILINAGGDLINRYNMAATVRGATAASSSNYPANDVSKVINGDRKGTAASHWASNTGAALPQTIDITLANLTLLDEINVILPQDNATTPVDPTLAMLAGPNYKITGVQIHVSSNGGSTLTQVFSTTTNDKIWIQAKPAAVLANFVRVTFTTKDSTGYCRCVEVEAWGKLSPSAPKTLVLARGQNGSAAAVHTKGSTVIEKKSTPLVYLVADHALDSIGSIMARVRDIKIDITDGCTKYLGTPGNQLAAYPGKAAITIPDVARVQQKIALTLSDSIGIEDALHGHAAGTVSTTTATAVNQALGSSTKTGSINLRTLTTGGIWTTYWGYLTWNFALPGGTLLTSTISAVISCPAGSNIYFGGVLVVANSAKYVSQTVSYTFNPASQATAMQSNVIQINVPLCTVAISVSQYTYDDIRSASATLHSATRTGTYNSTNSSNVSVSQTASGVKKIGSVKLSGNSVADVMIGDAILVDATRNLTAPLAVIGNLLSTYCGDATLQQTGTLPASYAINGAITEYKRAIEWVDSLAFQSRCFYRKIGGASRLIVRDTNPTVDGTIAACCLTDEGIKDLSYRKAAITDVINKVKVLFDRDWSAAASKQAESYRQSTASSDAASIVIYGEQERPDMFMFDFVTSPVMAADLATFYQDFYGDRKWRIRFSTFLDNCRFEFGDIVQLPFVGDLVGTIVEAGIVPGGIDKMDRLNFVVETAVITSAEATAITTLLGDQLMTKSREGLIYV